MIVVPGLEADGDTARMVDLLDADPACAVLRRVVCLPSAEVTSFKMVPAGRPPFVWYRGGGVNVSAGCEKVNVSFQRHLITWRIWVTGLLPA